MSLIAPEPELISFPPAARLSRLPVYVFARLDELKAIARQAGADLIDLGLGNPDQATPAPIVKAMTEALADVSSHGYPPFSGRPDFKGAIAAWMEKRYGVRLDPETETLPLSGSKEGLAHLAMAYVDHGDIALVPNPCYPVHLRGTLLSGGIAHDIPLTAETNFQPDLESIPPDTAAQAKLLVLNYPNNPTAAVASSTLLEEAVSFCRRHQILLVHDLAYGELYFGTKRPPSLLQIPGAKEIGVEFHTLSKTFNMAGWRLGFAVGNATVIKTLYALKTNIDYGVFGAIQISGIAALALPDSAIEKIRNTYRARRDLLIKNLKAMAWPVEPPEATMYIWLPLPQSLGMSSTQFAETLLSKTGIVVTPGVAFGAAGEGFVRISMVCAEKRLQEAMDRWQASGLTPEAAD